MAKQVVFDESARRALKGGIDKLAHADTRQRQELGRLAIAERDRAGLVQQESVDVARRLDRTDRKSTRLNSSHIPLSRMPSSA